MTYCSPLAAPLQKYIEEGKTLDEIGMKICGDSVKNPRRKAIRLIRILLDESTLRTFADSLHYDVDKANLSKKRRRSSQPKCSTEKGCNSTGTPEQCISESSEIASHSVDNRCYAEPDSEFRQVVEAVSALISRYGRDLVIDALNLLKISVYSNKETGVDTNSPEPIKQNTTRPMEENQVVLSEVGDQ